LKIWVGYGSEHSHNLVIVGRFKTATDANVVADKIGRLRELADKGNAIRHEEEWDEPRFMLTEELLEALMALDMWSFSPSDLESMNYDLSIDTAGDTITVTTDEIEVLGILKLLISGGARVDMYSAHDYPPPERQPGSAS
jgi:hypothetical protein